MTNIILFLIWGDDPGTASPAVPVGISARRFDESRISGSWPGRQALAVDDAQGTHLEKPNRCSG